MSEKIWQKGMAFAFGNIYPHQTFIEYMANHLLVHWCVRYITTSYGRPFDFIAFFGIFIHIHVWSVSIFTKLSQIVRLISVNSLVCQHAKCDYRLWKLLLYNCVFWEFSYITCFWNILTLSNFCRLLCIKVEDSLLVCFI